MTAPNRIIPHTSPFSRLDMPGLTQTQYEDDGQRDHTRLKDRRFTQSGRALPPRGADGQHDSYAVAGHRVAQTTGYGVNAPQWTEGPPPVIFGQSPYARVPLPRLEYARPITINPLLTPNGPASLIWTICQNPIGAACTSGLSHRDQYHWKSLPATNMPNVISLTIIVEPFPTPIVVLPTRGIITVWDVLAAIYNGVRRGATELFGAHSQLPGQVMWSAPPVSSTLFVQRPTLGDDEVCSIVRSYMGFQTRWVGLTPSPTDADVWILRTKPLVLR